MGEVAEKRFEVTWPFKCLLISHVISSYPSDIGVLPVSWGVLRRLSGSLKAFAWRLGENVVNGISEGVGGDDEITHA